MILDTEFLISLQAENPAALELAAEFEFEGIPTRLPTIVLEELYVGVGAVDILPALKGEDSFVGQQAVPTSSKAPWPDHEGPDCGL